METSAWRVKKRRKIRSKEDINSKLFGAFDKLFKYTFCFKMVRWETTHIKTACIIKV